MKNPSILYWKWDDSHIKTRKYIDEIDDIIERSCFDHLYITTHWCHEGITTKKMHDEVKKACDYIHSKGKKLIFEIDARAEKAVFVKKFPDRRTGFLYWKEIVLNSGGQGETSFSIEQGGGGELFLGNRQSGEEILRVYAYERAKKGYNPSTLINITNQSNLIRLDNKNVDVKVSAENAAGMTTFVAVVSWVDFGDLFSNEYKDFNDELFDFYSDIPLDGVALDELGYPWHVDFNFNPSTYMIWNNSPYFSWSMCEKYKEDYDRDYVLDYLNRFVGNSEDEKDQIKSINYYFEFIRKAVIEIENLFYYKAKFYYGENAFVGVHPTWFAIEEVDNTPEVWKNGIDWWEVTRDYGFTDEIMLYPVRLALTHKANANIFYNMWYSEATLKLDTFFTEIYRNARYGGRTISLAYECINEIGIVMQLKEKNMLEAISKAEKNVELLDSFQTSPTASDILIIMGIPAACNIQANMDGKENWNTYKSVFKQSFQITRGIWDSGYNCDLVGSYEVINGNVFIDNDGKLTYGNQKYSFIVFAYPDYCKKEIITFIEKIKATNSPCVILGEMNYDFDGNNVESEFNRILDGLHHFVENPEISDILALLKKCNIKSNRVECGSVLQDGSVILTCPAPKYPTNNLFDCSFHHLGHTIKVSAYDLVALKIDNDGAIEKIISPALCKLVIDEKVIYNNDIAKEIIIL